MIKNVRPHGHRNGKTIQKKEYHQAHNLKRDASRSILKGSTIASWKILNFVHPSSNMIEMKKFVSKWTILRTRISLITWQNQKISIQTELVHLSQQFWKHWTKRSVVYIKPSTPRIWRTTTQAHAILEVSILAPIIEFFFQLVAMEWFLVELIIIQRKSTNELTCKATW